MGQLERQSVKPGQRHVGFNLRESLSLFLLQSFYTHFGNHLHLKGSNCLILALNSPLKFSSASHIIFTPWGRKRVSGWILLMITNVPTHVNRSIIVPFPCSCSQSVMLISNCMYRKLLGIGGIGKDKNVENLSNQQNWFFLSLFHPNMYETIVILIPNAFPINYTPINQSLVKQHRSQIFIQFFALTNKSYYDGKF